jgi:hypothetical protein
VELNFLSFLISISTSTKILMKNLFNND